MFIGAEHTFFIVYQNCHRPFAMQKVFRFWPRWFVSFANRKFISTFRVSTSMAIKRTMADRLASCLLHALFLLVQSTYSMIKYHIFTAVRYFFCIWCLIYYASTLYAVYVLFFDGIHSIIYKYHINSIVRYIVDDCIKMDRQ